MICAFEDVDIIVSIIIVMSVMNGKTLIIITSTISPKHTSSINDIQKILNASRIPTSPSSASSCARRAQHSANMPPKGSENEGKNVQRGAKMKANWGQDAVRSDKKRKQTLS